MMKTNDTIGAPFRLVDTPNRLSLETLFRQLQPGTIAIWGKMTPQQMIEHLIDQVQYTNGTKEPFCEVSEEQAKLAKQANIYGPLEIPRNVTRGVLPAKLIYPDLVTAIRQLMKELDDFDKYFSDPETTAVHGAFGPMNYDEWLIWHSKHFTHHLNQFGLKKY
ncbi:oxepin-CoA hydrolase / 3-oxo-5,6-dehydrosuberyl-CoA semialdehyde dehydrogenase [Pedobacter steynii]|uniref:Oxepin-CoA hydrolase / 3-oxo-5,6-dehydrosuberyl-CoA semialdehyde dehydrogenase n=1 Tax=Pedobacter steynii TaxID=430522 RepID=A0A1G9L882_9SPHI|nr:DUF1569 domain-containing protein [Pedobacter steynii]NQX38774.1 DUF1569 domain-containing protein [Pedobacter steynii]SDL58152.1 oxepin-CoA hydrolase / 3-oxo-5,6-dehydrosuberyl-CoA semialdehyde dehydrogenase [Pedobacter steynii]